MMSKRKTVTVGGIPVTIQVINRELAVSVSRFDEAAASGLLRTSPGSGTAVLRLHVASANGVPAGRQAGSWVADLYPDSPGSTASLLLCDDCFQAATGQLAECQDGCLHDDFDHYGLCLRDSPDECQWCGSPDRLHEVLRADVQRYLPTVGEEGEGLWWLHFTDGKQGPFASAQAAWDTWHALDVRQLTGWVPASGDPAAYGSRSPGGPSGTEGEPA
jgi:hypothetical protein